MRIYGKIIDEFGALPDVNIVVLDSNDKPTTIGTITRADGTFSLDRSEITPNTTIQLSYIGYKTILATANTLQGDTLTMPNDIQELDEIELIGHEVPPKPKPTANLSLLWWLFPVAAAVWYASKTSVKPKKVKV